MKLLYQNFEQLLRTTTVDFKRYLLPTEGNRREYCLIFLCGCVQSKNLMLTLQNNIISINRVWQR